MNAVLDSDADKELHQKIGPGSRLKEERERQQLPLDKVAAQLHLNNELITALEKDEYDKLPSVVFVRGYVRNYARFLGLSDANLLEDLKFYYPDNNSPILKLANAQVQKEVRSSHGLVRFVTWLLILSTIAAIGAWWWNRTTASLTADKTVETTVEADLSEEKVSVSSVGSTDVVIPSVTNVQPIESRPVEMETDDVQTAITENIDKPVAVASVTDIQASEPVEVVKNETELVVEKSIPIESPAPSVPEDSSPVVSPDGVVLTFSKTSWIDIRDTTSSFKMIGNFSSGSRSLKGKGPYKVIIGNIKAVKMTIDGNEYNLRKHTNKGNVAKFVLNLNP